MAWANESMPKSDKETKTHEWVSVFWLSDDYSQVSNSKNLEKQNLIAYHKCIVKKVGVWRTAKVKPDYLFRETETLNISTILLN